MRRAGVPRERALATLVHLLEHTLIRIGNEAYARDNASFGLTTLTADHVEVEGATMTFEFVGKSGKAWKVTIRDRRAASVMRAFQELPGQKLFQYLDESGAHRAVSLSRRQRLSARDGGRGVSRPRISAPGRGRSPARWFWRAKPRRRASALSSVRSRRLCARPRRRWATPPPSPARATCIQPSSTPTARGSCARAGGCGGTRGARRRTQARGAGARAEMLRRAARAARAKQAPRQSALDSNRRPPQRTRRRRQAPADSVNANTRMPFASAGRATPVSAYWLHTIGG